MWSVPIVMIAMSAATTDYANLVDAGIGYVLLLVIATFFTGVNEELLFRGLALQSFRDRHREWVAGAGRSRPRLPTRSPSANPVPSW